MSSEDAVKMARELALKEGLMVHISPFLISTFKMVVSGDLLRFHTNTNFYFPRWGFPLVLIQLQH